MLKYDVSAFSNSKPVDSGLITILPVILRKDCKIRLSDVRVESHWSKHSSAIVHRAALFKIVNISETSVSDSVLGSDDARNDFHTN